MSRTFEAQAHRPGFFGPCNHVAYSQTDGRDACDLFASVTDWRLDFDIPMYEEHLHNSFITDVRFPSLLLSSVSDIHSIPECEASIVTCQGITSFPMQGLPATMEDLYENALESVIKVLIEFSH